MRTFLQVFIVIMICLSFARAGYCLDDSVGASQRINQAAELNNKGLHLREDGQLQESRTVLEQACLLDPNLNSSVIHENLGVTLERLGELSSARDEFVKALQFEPDRATTLYNLSGCYSQMGEINQAISTLQNFLYKYPNNEKAEEAKRMLLSLQRTPTLRDNPNAGDYLAGAMGATNKITRWSIDKQPIKVYIESGKKIEGYQPEFEEILVSAFDEWISVVKPRLCWQLIAKKRKADIVCRWSSDRKNFQQKDGAELGETRLNYLVSSSYSDCQVTSATMTLCTMNLEGTKVISEEQMKNLCLHEVGHALGINGHSSNHNDIMFLMTKECATTQLTQRDRNTLTHLYFLSSTPTYRANTYQGNYPVGNNYSGNYPSSYQNNYSNGNQGTNPYQNSYPPNSYPSNYQPAYPQSSQNNYSNGNQGAYPYQNSYPTNYQNGYPANGYGRSNY